MLLFKTISNTPSNSKGPSILLFLKFKDVKLELFNIETSDAVKVYP